MIEVVIHGLCGTTWEGFVGELVQPNKVIGTYEPGMRNRDGSKVTLLSIVKSYVLRYGGDFQDPSVFGLRLVHRKLRTSYIMGHGWSREEDHIIETAIKPIITPELSAWVAWELDNLYPLPFAPNKEYAVMRYDMTKVPEDDMEAEFYITNLEEDLTYHLDAFWERNLARVAPHTMDPDGPAYAPWDEWAGAGYFIVQANNVFLTRDSGWAQHKIIDGRDLYKFIHGHDDVGHFSVSFRGDHIVIHFSGKDTMSGVLHLYPCPDADWSD